jgi:hypothetical protein
MLQLGHLWWVVGPRPRDVILDDEPPPRVAGTPLNSMRLGLSGVDQVILPGADFVPGSLRGLLTCVVCGKQGGKICEV